MAEVQRELTAKGQPKLVVTDPEYTISIIGLVASFCSQPIVGLILSAMALRRSREAGRHNTYALTGFILSLVLLGVWILFVAFYVVLIVFSFIMSVSGHGR